MIRRDAAPLRSARGIEVVGKRPLVFRLLHFAGGTLRVFTRRNARGKDSRGIPVVLVGFKSRSLSVHFKPLDLQSSTIRGTRSSDSRFDAVTFVAHDFCRRQSNFWHRIVVSSAIPYEI
jgi:hypothetical protein